MSKLTLDSGIELPQPEKPDTGLTPPRRRPPLSGDPLIAGLFLYCTSLLLVLLGVTFGTTYLPSPGDQSALSKYGPPWVLPWTQIDARYYGQIVLEGYSERRMLAFFPLFPLFGKGLQACGVMPLVGLLLVAHVSLAALLCVLVRYLQFRARDLPGLDPALTTLVLALWPTALYCRMAYTESLFLLLMLLAMDALQRQQLGRGAFWAGLAAATRPVGIALVLPLCWTIWRSPGPVRLRLRRMLTLLPTGASGLLIYMAWQWWVWGDPLVFSRVQNEWVWRSNPPFREHVMSLITLEPLWAVFVPSSDFYWQNFQGQGQPLFSLRCMNPVLVAASWLLVGIGAWKRWLTMNEVLVAVGLLAIPYISHSHRGLMMAQGRYAFVAFPAYIVFGRMLASAPPAVSGIWFALSGFLLATWSALFAMGYEFI